MQRHQQGQVLPLGLVLLAFSMMGSYVLFNTGRVATDKMKLANTADAAAYSGTLWQARALNFQSYSNRAMVANQVAIGQAVSLQSWVSYGAIASENISTVLKPVPIINVVTDGLRQGFDVVERVVSPVAKAMLSVSDIVNRGLSIAQEAVFVSTFVATPDVIRSVVSETDDRFSINTAFSGLGLASNLNQWRKFTDGFSKNDAMAMDERLQMINDSRDDFTGTRNWKFFNFWFYSTPLLRHQIHREGLTKLIRVETDEGIEWEWKAKDTMSLQNRLWHWRGTRRYEVPIGWAEAFANSKGSDRTIEPNACTTASEMRASRYCARFLNKNRTSEYYADIGVTGLQMQESRIAMNGYTGVQAYRSLSVATREKENPTINLKVEVSLPVDAVRGSDQLGSRGQFSAPVVAPGNKLTSVSIAEVYYKRPDHDIANMSANLMEAANGYNPYWTARLSPVSNADRLTAFALRGDFGSNDVPHTSNGDLLGRPVDLASYEVQSIEQGLSGEGGFADALGEAVSTSISSSVGEFENVAASMATDGLDQFRRDIEEHLIAALQEQIGNMLAGAIAGSYGGNAQSLEELEGELTEMAGNELGDLVSSDAAEPFMEVVSEATSIADRLQGTFREIRDVIVREFQSVFEQAIEQFDAAVTPIKNELERQRLILANSMENLAEAAEQRIAELNAEVAILEENLRNELATQLIQIVSNSTDLYVMNREEALYLVGEFLRNEADEIELPWLDTADEGDTDE